MNFGEPSPCSVDTANGFMVERVKKTPPPRGNRVKFFNSMQHFLVDLNFQMMAIARSLVLYLKILSFFSMFFEFLLF